MEIELVPDPGAGDPAAGAALAALERELASGPEGRREWGVVAHSTAWRRAGVRDAVSRADGLDDTRVESGVTRPA